MRQFTGIAQRGYGSFSLDQPYQIRRAGLGRLPSHCGEHQVSARAGSTRCRSSRRGKIPSNAVPDRVFADFDRLQILLAGASTLLPGIANHLSMLVAPTVPVTSALDPSQVIAVGCALQAYHLAQLPDDLPLDKVLSNVNSTTASKPIGIVFPDSSQEGDSSVHSVVIPSGVRLPCRRKVQFAVAPGSSKVAVELWEASTTVDVTQIQPPAASDAGDADESDDEQDDELEEVRTVSHTRETLLAAGEIVVDGRTDVVLEVVLKADASVHWKVC